jgi:mannose-6-phosphate isomerase
MEDNFRINYSKTENISNKMVSCPYFTTNYLPVTNETLNKTNTFDSFIIYMCVEGEVIVKTKNHSEILKKGETLLLPASIKTFEITAKKAELLEVYV